jgi:tripartite-type tricarboxylate transporter receptor subunit TctC
MRRIAAALAMIAAIGWGAAAQAQSYPVRPVRLIVPFPAGGPVDVMGRLIAQSLSATLGQQVVVDNRPGAGSTLAGREAARAEPDGYTLLLGSAATLAIGPALFKNIGYDSIKSFTPVAFMSSVPYVMVAGPKAPAKTVKDVIAYAKANPGKLNLGVPNGAPPHMLAACSATRPRPTSWWSPIRAPRPSSPISSAARSISVSRPPPSPCRICTKARSARSASPRVSAWRRCPRCRP